MANEIRGKDLIKGVDVLAKEIADLSKSVAALRKEFAETQKMFDKNSKSQSDLAKKTKAVSAADKELEKIRKRQNKVTIETVRATEELRKKRKALTDQVRKEQGTFKKSGGLFRSMTKSILAAGAAMFGIQKAIQVFKKGINTIKNFEKAMSEVNAIAIDTTLSTEEQSKQFKALQKNALLLGSTTSKTATQVAQLQKEFAKLGFSTAEILNATEATISLSIAAGSDLAESAVVAASTIRGFGLSAVETQRVVDVMAKSFTSSALDLEKFKTAMATVAPVAKASGKNIEFTTSQLAILADAGLDASTAGTSLRNMFLELNKQGLTWEQGLAKINNSTNKNVTALELFGKRGATAGLILADNVEKANDLEKAFDEAAGSAEKMAEIMEDNLAGEIERTKSKWEGFTLSLNKGDGALANVIRNLVKLWGEVAEGFRILSIGMEEYSRQYKEAALREELKNDAAALVSYYRDVYGESQVLIKLREDEKISLRDINELEQERLAATDDEIVAQLELSIMREKIMLENLRNSIVAIEAEKKAKIEAEEEAQRIKTLEAENAAKKRAKAQKKIDEEVEQERLTAFQKAKKAQEDRNSQADRDKIARAEESSEEEIQLLQDQLAEEYRLKQEAAEAEIALAEKISNDDKLRTQEKLNNAAMVIDAIGQGAQDIFNLQQSLADSEIENIERQRDAEIAAAEKRGEDTSKIEKKFADKEAKLRTEQAKKEKQQAIFAANINIASGILKTIGSVGLPAAIPLIALLGALGAIQLATIAAEPLPKFEKGGKVGGNRHSQGGTVIEAEKDEFIVSRIGYANAPELTEMINKGILKDSDLLPSSGRMFSGADTKELAQQNSANIIGMGEMINQPTLTRKGVEYINSKSKNKETWVNQYL
jgi:hypothetical protein